MSPSKSRAKSSRDQGNRIAAAPPRAASTAQGERAVEAVTKKASVKFDNLVKLEIFLKLVAMSCSLSITYCLTAAKELQDVERGAAS